MQFLSFEEVITCVGAIAAGFVAQLLGRNWVISPALTFCLVTLVFGVVLVAVTTTRFAPNDEEIVFGSVFWSDSVRLREIEQVIVRPSLGIVPGRVVLFRMRPGSHVAMTSTRVGVWSWPSAYDWAAAANAAIRKTAE